jgi:phosphonate transport system permease protein
VAAVAVLVALAGLALWSLLGFGFTVSSFTESLDKVGPFLRRMVPLGLPPAGELAQSIVTTLSIVLLGTAISAVLSIPVAYISARNTSPRPWLVPVGRTIGVVARAIPDVILAMLFTLLFSLGALPGIVAIALHSIGMISKMFADAIEQIDEGPRNAVRATGASRVQEFWSGVFPQVLPSWVATFLHRCDINLRASVLLGYAGVTGLGYDLWLRLQYTDYRHAVPIALVILLLCVAFELVSTLIRRRLLGGGTVRRGDGAAGASAVTGSSLGHAGPDPSVHSSVRPPPDDRGAAIAAASHRPWTRDRLAAAARRLAIGVILILAIVGSHAKWLDLVTFWRNVPLVAERAWPPSFGPRSWSMVRDAVFTTVQIALIATLLSGIMALVLAPLAARNVAPNAVVRGLARGLLLAIRAVPDLILAIVLIIVTGLGRQAGTIALAIGGLGLLGKLVADSLEETPPGPEVAVRAAGGTRLQVLFAATFRLNIPAFIGHSLYLFDTNLRSATLLGIVGAGGIGYYLIDASRVSRYDQVTALVAVLIALVLVVEGIAVLTRRALR